jgi:hypothetical protein
MVGRVFLDGAAFFWCWCVLRHFLSQRIRSNLSLYKYFNRTISIFGSYLVYRAVFEVFEVWSLDG